MSGRVVIDFHFQRDIATDLSMTIVIHPDLNHQVKNGQSGQEGPTGFRLQRPVPNTFKASLTDEQKDEIARKCIELKGESKKPASVTIRWWIKAHYPEEFEKHEKYRDWNTCFITRDQLKRWVFNMQRLGTHRKRRSTKWDRLMPNAKVAPVDQSPAEIALAEIEDHIVVKEEPDSEDYDKIVETEGVKETERSEKSIVCDKCSFCTGTKSQLRYHIESKLGL